MRQEEMDKLNRSAIGNARIEEILERAKEGYEKMKSELKIPFLDDGPIDKKIGFAWDELWMINVENVALDCINGYMVDGFCNMPTTIKEKGQGLFDGLGILYKEVKQLRKNIGGKAEKLYIESENSSVVEEVCHSFCYLHSQDKFSDLERRNFFLDFVRLKPKINTIYM